MRALIAACGLAATLSACAGGYVETLGPNSYRVTVEQRADAGADELAEAEAERIAEDFCRAEGRSVRSARTETTSNDMRLNGEESSYAKAELTFRCG